MDGFLSTIANILPIVGTAVGGPAGTAIGGGLGVLLRQLTGESNPEAAAALIAADPIKLKEFEFQFAQLQAQVYQAELADTQDARNQQVRLAQAGTRIAMMPSVISLFALGIFCATLGWVLWLVSAQGTLTPEQREIIYFIMGLTAGHATQAVQFWLGSSSRSHEKDNVIKTLTGGK